jgi:hypothetical protein
MLNGTNNRESNAFLNSKNWIVCFAMVLCFQLLSSPVLSVDPECPKPNISDNPFADLDDLMTEDEKREALHQELERKLALHKSPCDPNNKAKTPSQKTRTQQAQNNTQANQQSGQAATNGQSNQVNADNTAETQSNANSTQNSKNTSSAPGQYSSPWASQNPAPANPNTIQLEPIAEAEKTADAPTPVNAQSNTQTNQASNTGSEGIKSAPVSGISGLEESTQKAQKPTANGAKKQESEFLKKYGSPSQPETESIEDIANRHKNQSQYGYATPGNTGPNQQTPNYSDPRKEPSTTQTVGADASIVAALEKRLENEEDPEKRKEIQAEIDKYKKK